MRKPKSHLRHEDDMKGRAARISSRWIVDHTVKVGIRRPNGRNIGANYKILRKGDFVEVAVSIDVVTYRRGGSRRTCTMLMMNEIVRLWTAKETKVSEVILRGSHYLLSYRPCTLGQMSPRSNNDQSSTTPYRDSGLLRRTLQTMHSLCPGCLSNKYVWCDSSIYSRIYMNIAME